MAYLLHSHYNKYVNRMAISVVILCHKCSYEFGVTRIIHGKESRSDL